MEKKDKQYKELLYRWKNAKFPSQEHDTAWGKLLDVDGGPTERLRTASTLSTWELVHLLRMRTSVEEKMIAPYDNVSINVEGPACVLVITD